MFTSLPATPAKVVLSRGVDLAFEMYAFRSWAPRSRPPPTIIVAAKAMLKMSDVRFMITSPIP